MLELIDIDKWCDACLDTEASKLLVDKDGTILGWYCDPCGEQELGAVQERRKPRARCHFNENSNRPCVLDDKHTGGHNLPCVESSAHLAHAKGNVGVDGRAYMCPGHRFDYT